MPSKPISGCDACPVTPDKPSQSPQHRQRRQSAHAPRPEHPPHPAPSAVQGALGEWLDLFCGQCHADHGGGLDDGGDDGLVLSGRAGADRGVPADVPVLAARRCAGRHHGPAPPDPDCARHSGRRRHPARRVDARAHWWSRNGAVFHLPVGMLYRLVVAGLELFHRRLGAAPRVAPGHYRGRHRL